MKDRILTLVKIVIGVSLLAFVLVNIQDQSTKTSKKQEEVKQEQASKLKIALVNEGLGTKYNDNEYNLGSSYIKKVEKDPNQEWITVSRGIAESGLKNGNYNLMITIPTNFSEKILSLDEVAPEKVNVTYKVNSNGNKDLENEANKVGARAIEELNQQLVDIYIASILDNLYTSQKNVQSIVNNQNQKIGEYESFVYQPTANFRNNLTAMDSTSKNSMSASEGLENTLKSYLGSYESYQKSQENYQTSLQKLLEERATEQKDYAQFVEALLSMDQSLLSTETNQLYDLINATSLIMKNEFDDKNKTNFNQQMVVLQEQLADADQRIAKQTKEITTIIESTKTYIDNQLVAKFWEKTTEPPGGINQVDPKDSSTWQLSVYDFLVGTKPELKEQLDTYIEEVKAGETIIYNHAKNNLRSLPYTNVAGIPPELEDYFVDQTQYEALTSSVDMLEKKLAKNPEIQSEMVIDDRGNQLETAYNAINAYYEKTITSQITPESRLTKNTEVSATTTSTAVTNLTAVRSKNNQNIVLSYGYNQAAILSNNFQNDTKMITVKMTNPSDTSGGSPVVTTVTVPIDFSTFATDKYKSAVSTYTKLVDGLLSDYDVVNSELDLLNDLSVDENPLSLTDINNRTSYFSSRLTSVLNLSVYEYIQLLSENIMAEKFREYQEFTDQNGLTALSKTIQEEMPQIAEKMVSIQNTTIDLQDQLQNQLKMLDDWRQQSKGISTQEKSVTAFQNLTDTQIESLNEQMKSLLTQSGSMRESSALNIEQSNSVTKIFDEFNQSSIEIGRKTDQLSADATTLKSDFDKQKSDSGSFISQFSSVMGNAYKDGVPNSNLMSFLSNPVSNVAQGSIQSADTYKPFSWVMMLFVISLFAGYAFSTKQIQLTIVDVFGEKKWIASNFGTTMMATITALAFGGLLGVLSGRAIGVPIDERVLWVIVVLFLVLSYTLLNSFLNKQFRLYGLGIGLLFLTGYIFLTDAVGTSGVTNDFLTIMKTWNPLYQGEKLLGSFFTIDGLQGKYVVWLFAAILGTFIANLFVWHPGKKFSFTRKKEGLDEK